MAPPPRACRRRRGRALAGEPIVGGMQSAQLEDGTLAGSIITMDHAFRMLVRAAGLPIEVARLCADHPGGPAGPAVQGRLEPGPLADLVVLEPGCGWCRPG